MSTNAEGASESEEQMICPSCHAPNSPLAGFCVSCRAPLNSTVMLDPMGQIEAEGFALREATLGKPKLIVVLGIWLLLFPLVVTFGFIAAMDLSLDYPPLADRLPSLVLPSLVTLFCLIVLYKATANYRRRSREQKESISEGSAVLERAAGPRLNKPASSED